MLIVSKSVFLKTTKIFIWNNYRVTGSCKDHTGGFVLSSPSFFQWLHLHKYCSTKPSVPTAIVIILMLLVSWHWHVMPAYFCHFISWVDSHTHLPKQDRLFHTTTSLWCYSLTVTLIPSHSPLSTQIPEKSLICSLFYHF